MRIFLVLLLLVCGTILARAQDPEDENQQEDPPAEQKAITDPAEYEAYITAINTTHTLESRKAALEAFLQRFPNSIMRDQTLDALMEIMVRLDNQRTAAVRADLRFRQLTSEMYARNLALVPDKLNHYTQCNLGQFIVEESSERDRLFYRTVTTSEGDRQIEVIHTFRLHIAYQGTPFVNFIAERLGTSYATDKKTLIEGLRGLSTEPDTEPVVPWPAFMSGFEVYGINRQRLGGGVLSIYMLFHDADQTVVTIYLLNTPPESPKFRTLDEYHGLRDQFLKTYTTCFDAPAKAPLRHLSAKP
jgi:hypothetical protein